MKNIILLLSLFLLIPFTTFGQVVGNGGTDQSGPISGYQDLDSEFLSMKSLFKYKQITDPSNEREKKELSECSSQRVNLKDSEYLFRKLVGKYKEYSLVEFNQLLDRISLELVSLGKNKLSSSSTEDDCSKCNDGQETKKHDLQKIERYAKSIKSMNFNLRWIAKDCKKFFEPSKETKVLIEKIGSLNDLIIEIEK